MSLFPTWPRAGEPLDGGLDVELAGRPGLAGLVLKGRMPLLYLFIEVSHQRLFRRLAKEEFGTQPMLRVVELSRQTANVAALSMWRAAWGGVLPGFDSRGQLRVGLDASMAFPFAKIVTDDAWRAVQRHFGPVARYLALPGDLEAMVLDILPDGDGVGVDAEQVYSDEDLEGGFFLSVRQELFAPFPGLERYIDHQLERVGSVLARNYVTPQLCQGCLRFSRAVTTIAAASVWHSAWRGLDRPVPSPTPREPSLFDEVARRR